MGLTNYRNDQRYDSISITEHKMVKHDELLREALKS